MRTGTLRAAVRWTCGLALCGSLGWTVPTAAGTVSARYTDLPLGTTTDLTATGTLDWVKWGVEGGGPAFTTARKNGVTPAIGSTLTPLGIAFPGTIVTLIGIAPGQNVLNFGWTDGDSPPASSTDTVVTETLLPPQNSYPLALGASMTASASAEARVLDVYVQGFNAAMLITATMSGGGIDSVVVSPTKNPPADPANNYSSGRYRVTFSGAGETLTVSVQAVNPFQPGSVGFPNAGFFAATLAGADRPAITVLQEDVVAVQPGGRLSLAWTATPGATQYGLEFTGRNLPVANPGGDGPDAVNGFGGAGGGFLVGTGTSTTVTVPAGTPPGAYNARIVGLSPTLGPVGRFSEAVTLLVGAVAGGQPTFTSPANGSALQRLSPVALGWTPVAGAAAFLLEFEGGPEPGRLGGNAVVVGTSLPATVPGGIPAGLYRLRVLALSAGGAPIGSFSPPLFLVIQ